MVHFSIGDLVRLKQDIDNQIGFGFVTEIKEDLSDTEYYRFFDISNNHHLDSLHLLVYWTLRKSVSQFNGYIWMYPSQISVVKKLIVEEEKA